MTYGPPPDHPLQQGSLYKLQELVPVRVATSRVLDGDWFSKQPLTAVRAIGSAFGGKHFILQIGYELGVGTTLTFRLVFVASMPADDIESAEAKADALRTAQAFMHMLNMRRKDGPGFAIPDAPSLKPLTIKGTRPKP